MEQRPLIAELKAKLGQRSRSLGSRTVHDDVDCSSQSTSPGSVSRSSLGDHDGSDALCTAREPPPRRGLGGHLRVVSPIRFAPFPRSAEPRGGAGEGATRATKTLFERVMLLVERRGAADDAWRQEAQAALAELARSVDARRVGQLAAGQFVAAVDLFFRLAAATGCTEAVQALRPSLAVAEVGWFEGSTDLGWVAAYVEAVVQHEGDVKIAAVICAIGRRFGMKQSVCRGTIRKLVHRHLNGMTNEASLQKANDAADQAHLFGEDAGRVREQLRDAVARLMAQAALKHVDAGKIFGCRGICEYRRVGDPKEMDELMFRKLLESDRDRRSIERWIMEYCWKVEEDPPHWIFSHEQWAALWDIYEAQEAGTDEALVRAFTYAADVAVTAVLEEEKGKVAKRLTKRYRLPSQWDVATLAACQVFHTAVTLETCPGVELFQAMFTQTFCSVTTVDRRGPMPRGLVVQRVEEVQNVRAWSDYGKTTSWLRSKTTGGLSTPAPLLTAQCGQDILKAYSLPALKPGEALLLHGTSASNAVSIAGGLFDAKHQPNKSQLAGPGVYLGESVAKADEYCDQGRGDLHAMLVCRVYLGHIMEDNQPNPTMIRKKCWGKGKNSLVMQRKYREFVVFDGRQVYPHFLVWYKRQ
mmetsp:Transcript_23959/g.52868  ORF Transcript_23959/g.52868 Transcript_23959/m.52868 type:complete len:641 (-) Transcript_23959:109-2031(-)